MGEGISTKLNRGRPRRITEEELESLTDDELLNQRICDLPLRIKGSQVEPCVRQLRQEIASRGLLVRISCYLSEEWFVASGHTSIGVPFYLANNRLRRLEKRFLFDVEGGTPDQCMMLLRHEAGHAVDNAYGVMRLRERQKLFGLSSSPYPEHYSPKPHSRSYVRHIPNWYAQSHPDEDFAETFAVWLTPGYDWRTRYRNWKRALSKLEFVDQALERCRGRTPTREDRGQPFHIRTLRQTVREFYEGRIGDLSGERDVEVVEADLRRLFPEADPALGEPAWRVLRRHRATLRRVVGRWSGLRRYHVDRMLTEVTVRLRELGLRNVRPDPEILMELTAFGVALSKNHLFSGEFSMTA